jgi:glycosyltransferase involved in cell wall biosynthesis
VTLDRLLAVTHAASITGAPMNLAHLLEWITQNTRTEVHTLVLEEGPLVPRFAQYGEVTVLDRATPAKAIALAERGFDKLGAERLHHLLSVARLGPQLRNLGSFDVTYLNSATSVTIANHLPRSRAVVSHVHELAVAVRTMEPHDQKLLRTIPDGWIAASTPVRNLLVDELGLPGDRVLLHDEFITASILAKRVVPPREIASRRRQLHLPDDAAIVMGSGTLDWRKGPDLFIQLACEVRRRTRRPVHFVWIGGEHLGTDWQRVRSDRDRAGADHVHFVETQGDPVPWFSMADVFALTSREDPLPLVCLESAALGIPLVTYRNGGIPGLLEAAGPDAAAGVADHLDVVALSEKVLDLLQSDERRKGSAQQAQARVLDHHDVGAAAPRLLADLAAMVDTKPRRA